MLSKIFAVITRVPFLKKRLWRSWYEYLAKSYRASDWSFMNYGFVDGGRLVLNPADESDRFCIQLYNHVAGGVELKGQRVLEVGCGRGGGASFVKRYLKPSQMTGVDLSENAVQFCRKNHKVHGLTFRAGDAERLPFPDASFDAVINVESSHCYPSLPRFFTEVRRVLKPGGHFLYADLHEKKTVDVWRASLTEAGFTIESEKEITANVLTALDQDNDRKVKLIHRLVPSMLRASFNDFAGVRGSKIYEAFRSGSLVYFSFTCRGT
jgi:SAM-dependent methyltransferase